MKRYNLVFRDDYGKLTSYGYLDEVESSEGEWVRYEDAIWMIRSLMDDVKRERAACAKVAEAHGNEYQTGSRHKHVADAIAEGIRARGEE